MTVLTILNQAGIDPNLVKDFASEQHLVQTEMDLQKAASKRERKLMRQRREKLRQDLDAYRNMKRTQDKKQLPVIPGEDEASEEDSDREPEPQPLVCPIKPARAEAAVKISNLDSETQMVDKILNSG